MLLQIRDLIKREHVVSTQQLTRQFCIDEQALQPILNIWINKGIIRISAEKQDCKSACFRCKTKPAYYEFVKQ